RDQLADGLRREPAAVGLHSDPVTEVRALQWATHDVRQRDSPGDLLGVQDREPMLVLALEPFQLALGRVEALAAVGFERREEDAVLDQQRRELARVVCRERTNHRATTRR